MILDLQELARRMLADYDARTPGQRFAEPRDLTYDGCRRRLAGCFDETAQEFLPHLETAARSLRPDTSELARYIVTVIEGAIMQARTLGDAEVLPRQLGLLNRQTGWFLCSQGERP